MEDAIKKGIFPCELDAHIGQDYPGDPQANDPQLATLQLIVHLQLGLELFEQVSHLVQCHVKYHQYH